MKTYADIKNEFDPVIKKLHEDAVYQECTKCNGTGNLEHYHHIHNGLCFKCGGKKRFPKNNAAKMKIKLLQNGHRLLRDVKIFGDSFDCEKSETYAEMISILKKLPKKYK